MFYQYNNHNNNNYRGYNKNYINFSNNHKTHDEIHLKDEYKIKTYSVDGKIDPNLIDEKTKNIAEFFSKQKLTYTQLRSFYGECLTYKDLKYEDLKGRLILMKAKIAYAKGRKTIIKEFYEFMENRINCIKTKEDFDFFLMHFMALVGYFKYFTKDKE